MKRKFRYEFVVGLNGFFRDNNYGCFVLVWSLFRFNSCVEEEGGVEEIDGIFYIIECFIR